MIGRILCWLGFHDWFWCSGAGQRPAGRYCLRLGCKYELRLRWVHRWPQDAA